jgi:transcription elongation factor GreA
MLDEIRAKIESELERLTHELNVELPERIRIAVEHGDLRENAEYKSALERQQFVQARIGHLQGRMSELAKIDVKAMAWDRVGFGSRVRVRDHFMEEVVEFSIVAGDYMDLDGGQVSIASPIGRGLLGAAEGEDVVIALPVGERTFTIVELTTLPQQIGLNPADVDVEG